MQMFIMMPLTIATPPLERVLTTVITRHGIRVPYPPFEHQPMSIFSRDDRDWLADPAAWGADRIAALTSHGKEVLRLMGAHVGETLLPAPPYNFTVYADLDHTNRDIETAEAFMRGAWPAANFSVSQWDRTHPEYMRWLFNQGNSSTATCDVSGRLPRIVLGEVGGSFARLSEEQAENIQRLGEAIDCCKPAVCSHTTASGGGRASTGKAPTPNSSKCTLMDIPTYWQGQSAYWRDFYGPLTAASALIEYLQLLYLNNMKWESVAAGSRSTGAPPMSAGELMRLMRMHERVMDIADDYYNAQSAGSEMLVHIAATMQQHVNGIGSKGIAGLHSHPSDALVYYAGHDINIYLLRKLLNLGWLTESYNPNESPPGGFLTFELYRNSTRSGSRGGAKHGVGGEGGAAEAGYFVKAFFMSQSYQQQRTASPLTTANPAGRSFVLLPSCAHGPELSCPFTDFKALVLRVVRTECVQLVDPAVLVRPPK